MRIDFVSDVVCPWCAIGLASLRTALARVEAEVGPVDVHVQPFELNPSMAPEGEAIVDHLRRKYGLTPEQLAANRDAIAERGRAVGFTFGPRTRIVNTFDAHRLLHWASVDAGPGAALRLKQALLEAYHGRGESPAERDVLLRCVADAGLDPVAAGAEFDDRTRHADAVRTAERHWTSRGIQGVPAVVIDGRHLVSGGQPPEVFEAALRQVAAQAPEVRS